LTCRIISRCKAAFIAEHPFSHRRSPGPAAPADAAGRGRRSQMAQEQNIDKVRESPKLHGRSILIVEDEPLIALDIAQAFEDAGAEIVVTSTLHHALVLVEHDGLSAAVLDHALHDWCAPLKRYQVD
jgi:PleD family two-component response regulator